MSHFKSLIARWRCLFKGERREEDTNNNPTMIYRFNQAKGDASLLFTRTISFEIQQVSPSRDGNCRDPGCISIHYAPHLFPKGGVCYLNGGGVVVTLILYIYAHVYLGIERKSKAVVIYGEAVPEIKSERQRKLTENEKSSRSTIGENKRGPGAHCQLASTAPSYL